jgi:hypothetical protein
MSASDSSLLYQARKLITGANVHRVGTWIFCFETSTPRSKRHRQYGHLLKEFVSSESFAAAERIDSEILKSSQKQRESSRH